MVKRPDHHKDEEAKRQRMRKNMEICLIAMAVFSAVALYDYFFFR